MTATFGYPMRNVDDKRGRAYDEIMAVLRPLDWLDRMAVCDTLWNNGEFCFSCGKEKQDSEECECGG